SSTGLGQGASLISYNQDYDTGTVRVWGDYALSGSTLTLDYASSLYQASAFGPILVYNQNGLAQTSSVTISGINNAYAISQAITITYNGTGWDVTGSSTPGTLCTISGDSGTSDCPVVNPQFQLTVNGDTPVTGDIFVFGLIAASTDTYHQKKLLFGPPDSTYN